MLMYVEFVLYDLFAMDLNKLYLNLNVTDYFKLVIDFMNDAIVMDFMKCCNCFLRLLCNCK